MSVEEERSDGNLRLVSPGSNALTEGHLHWHTDHRKHDNHSYHPIPHYLHLTQGVDDKPHSEVRLLHLHHSKLAVLVVGYDSHHIHLVLWRQLHTLQTHQQVVPGVHQSPVYPHRHGHTVRPPPRLATPATTLSTPSALTAHDIERHPRLMVGLLSAQLRHRFGGKLVLYLLPGLLEAHLLHPRLTLGLLQLAAKIVKSLLDLLPKPNTPIEAPLGSGVEVDV
eukprot:CAMPEP_0173331652 /NCGR_PEP_ID=MMETSP1144-20121109/3914_1 /TAXON_ID=483371 /ORGANISM="non described non described, Strain CCMP2298" /LENGTH=222 /DNA_ID=CAMNT_0014276445 /DNA_START=135 /DNA_END=802 /DNA_ORIENTATION=-